MPEYHAMRALELVRKAQSGRVSAQELAEYFLRRIEHYDQSLGLNAVGELNPQNRVSIKRKTNAFAGPAWMVPFLRAPENAPSIL